jgi:GT2 family glycosyltransferase/uncharacterized membrane protein
VASLSVVVCAYTTERWSDLQRAVASIRAQTRPVQQILVVVDHHAELLRLCRDVLDGVAVLENTGPPGLSSGRNTGAAAATGEVVAFLDDDARADPTWADRLLSAYDEPHVMGVGGQVLPDWRAPRPDWFPEEFLWVLGCSYRGQPSSRAVVRNAIGANMSFRRDVFERVGGFNPTIGRVGKDAAGCEETEFSVRAVSVVPGASIVLEPSAVVHHVVTPQRLTRSYFRRRCLAEGRSKAIVSQLVGQQQALSSERTYASRVLPRAVLTGLVATLLGDPSGVRRSWAVCEGFALTALAYTRWRLLSLVRR